MTRCICGINSHPAHNTISRLLWNSMKCVLHCLHRAFRTRHLSVPSLSSLGIFTQPSSSLFQVVQVCFSSYHKIAYHTLYHTKDRQRYFRAFSLDVKFTFVGFTASLSLNFDPFTKFSTILTIAVN